MGSVSGAADESARRLIDVARNLRGGLACPAPDEHLAALLRGENR